MGGKNIKFNENHVNLVAKLEATGYKEFERSFVFDCAESVKCPQREADWLIRKSKRVSYNCYDISQFFGVVPDQPEICTMTKPVEPTITEIEEAKTRNEVFVPERVKEYVKWGHAKNIERIIKSARWFPVYVAGLSGNGKTMMIEQACARTKREYVRVQITPETDEDDLIGGFRLINNETKFEKGPVIRAMETGAILLIDEIDRSSNKIMCLQGVLEGNPVLIKKTGEVVKPVPGFNIISTANTKGKGSDDGRFSSAIILDEAFLERFNICIEQPYPTVAIEKRIVISHMKKYSPDGKPDEDFAEKLCKWSDSIRKTFTDGGIDEVISTRRLCHIVEAFYIFDQNRIQAVELCIARFDDENKEGMMDLYKKFDPPESDKVETEEFDEEDNMAKKAWSDIMGAVGGQAATSGQATSGQATSGQAAAPKTPNVSLQRSSSEVVEDVDRGYLQMEFVTRGKLLTEQQFEDLMNGQHVSVYLDSTDETKMVDEFETFGVDLISTKI